MEDQAVMDAWQEALVRYRGGLGKVQRVLLALFFVLLILDSWVEVHFISGYYFLALLVVLAVVMVRLELVARKRLLCPHCHRTPVRLVDRRLVEMAMWCSHCDYQLVRQAKGTHTAPDV